MKTTPLYLKLNLAAFVLILATCNSPAPVVGYINVVINAGWTPVVNQLRTPSSSANSVLISGAADGSLLYRYDPAAQDFFSAATYLAGVGWYPPSGDTNDPVLNLPLGEGFFVWSPRTWTNTFVGEVAEGALTNQLPLNYSLKGSMVPQAGLLQTDLKFPPDPGDRVWRGVPSAFSQYNFDVATWSPSQPSVNVAEGFFVKRTTTANHPWVRNFTVQRPAGAAPPELSDPAPEILSFSIRDGVVTLKVSKTARRYNVQFSGDRQNWTTIAANQTATTWKGLLPPGPRGFFQVTQP